jgi:hypothetical protein
LTEGEREADKSGTRDTMINNACLAQQSISPTRDGVVLACELCQHPERVRIDTGRGLNSSAVTDQKGRKMLTFLGVSGRRQLDHAIQCFIPPKSAANTHLLENRVQLSSSSSLRLT